MALGPFSAAVAGWIPQSGPSRSGQPQTPATRKAGHPSKITHCPNSFCFVRFNAIIKEAKSPLKSSLRKPQTGFLRLLQPEWDRNGTIPHATLRLVGRAKRAWTFQPNARSSSGGLWVGLWRQPPPEHHRACRAARPHATRHPARCSPGTLLANLSWSCCAA